MNTNRKKPLVYVVPDIERALGREPGGDYFVITNRTPYAESVAKKYPDAIWLVDGDSSLDTYGLLSRPEVIENIKKYDTEVIVFKNTLRIERLATEHGVRLLNPSAVLGRTVEEKISQVKWLGPLASLLPPHHIIEMKNVVCDGKKIVLQWNHAHTGEGTSVVSRDEELSLLKTKFPDRKCRVTDFVDGFMFTVNAVVAGDRTLVGNVSFQITGLAPFADLPYSTVGNDWALPYKILKKAQGAEIERIAGAVGERLREAGWRGLFGIDVICETKTGKIYLIEINARQPASTTLESQLQKKAGAGLTVFDTHIRALRGEKIVGTLQEIRDGAQIVQRVTKTRDKKTLRVDVDKLEGAGFGVIRYENDEPNSDLVRITSSTGIMDSPTTLNTQGYRISSSLS